MNAAFLEELAKARPNPGGGAAAAYGASLGLALLEKVVKLERRRPENDENTGLVWEGRLTELQGLQQETDRLREADVAAYLHLAEARRTGEGLAAALEEAIDCPRRIMAAARRGLEVVAAAGGTCRLHLISDLQVAAEFLGAALAGAYHIAAANLPLLASPDLRQNHAGGLEALFQQGNLTLQAVRQALAARAAPPGGP